MFAKAGCCKLAVCRDVGWDMEGTGAAVSCCRCFQGTRQCTGCAHVCTAKISKMSHYVVHVRFGDRQTAAFVLACVFALVSLLALKFSASRNFHSALQCLALSGAPSGEPTPCVA